MENENMQTPERETQTPPAEEAVPETPEQTQEPETPPKAQQEPEAQAARAAQRAHVPPCPVVQGRKAPAVTR